MFSEKQIEFMKRIGLSVGFDNPSDDEIDQIEEKISGYLQKNGFDKDDEPNEVGKICEEILDAL